MLSGDRAYISDVIQGLIEGTEVFQTAGQSSQSSAATEVLDCIVKARLFASEFLQDLLNRDLETPVVEHAFGSVLHKMYPDMLKRLPADTDPALIRSLANEEENTLHIMQSAMDNLNNELLKSVLMDLNPRLNRAADPISFDRAS